MSDKDAAAGSRVLPSVTTAPMVKGSPMAAAMQRRRTKQLGESVGSAAQPHTRDKEPAAHPLSRPQTPSPSLSEELIDYQYTARSGIEAVPQGQMTFAQLAQAVSGKASPPAAPPAEIDEGWHPGEVTKRGPQVRHSNPGLAAAAIKHLGQRKAL